MRKHQIHFEDKQVRSRQQDATPPENLQLHPAHACAQTELEMDLCYRVGGQELHSSFTLPLTAATVPLAAVRMMFAIVQGPAFELR